MKLKSLVCILFVHQLAWTHPTICLNMIVKNESPVIRRALDSVKDWIDYWVIVDTGSTDGTQQIIKEHMEGIPGQLEERPWKNFAHNRNEALELAKPKADYILFLDADDWFQIEGDFQPFELSDEAYTISWHHGKGCTYSKTQLVKADLPWHWVGVLHEYLTCDRHVSLKHLPQIKYMYGGDGARSQDPEKYLKAARIFEEALEEEPNNVRYVFYLAESYRDAGKHEEAIKYYLKRAEMGGFPEEIFWSLLQVGHLKNALNYPVDDIIHSYYRAHRFRPHRPEPVYYLANVFNKTGNHAMAYACLKSYPYIPQPATKDFLFNMSWISDHGLSFELSLAAFYLGFHDEFATLCHQLLANEKLPDNFKNSVENNLRLILKNI